MITSEENASTTEVLRAGEKLCGKGPWGLVDSKPRWALAAKRDNNLLGCTAGAEPIHWRKGLSSATQHLSDHHTTGRVPCLVLDLPVLERKISINKSKFSGRVGALALWGEVEGTELVKPGEAITSGGQNSCPPPAPMGRLPSRYPGLRFSMAGGQATTGINWKKCGSDWV